MVTPASVFDYVAAYRRIAVALITSEWGGEIYACDVLGVPNCD